MPPYLLVDTSGSINEKSHPSGGFVISFLKAHLPFKDRTTVPIWVGWWASVMKPLLMISNFNELSIVNQLNYIMNFIDLFCGCGGLSEGFLTEGFEPTFLADNDKYAMETTSNRLFQSGFEHEKVKSICHVSDLTQNDSLELFKTRVTNQPDTILAGIPCQAFSTVGRAQDKHSMKNDKRNYLYTYLMNYVEAVKPKTVIIENVSGLLSAKPKNNKNILDEIFKNLNS